MVVCPLCENVQPSGEECDVCGRALAPVPGVAATAASLEGLEPTRHADEAADASRLEGLEPTLLEPVPAVPGPQAPADWVEPAPLDSGVEVLAAAVELEPTRYAGSPDAPRDPFALVACRYCRTPAPPGDLFCSRCGIKLEVYRPTVRPPSDD